MKRNPHEIMQSRYSTAVLEEDWKQFGPPAAGSKEADLFCLQSKIVEEWHKAIGKDMDVSLNIYKYTKKDLIENSIEKTLLYLLGIEANGVSSKKIVNKSLSKPILFLIVVINIIKAKTRPGGMSNRLLENTKRGLAKMTMGSKYQASQRYIKNIKRHYKNELID